MMEWIITMSEHIVCCVVDTVVMQNSKSRRMKREEITWECRLRLFIPWWQGLTLVAFTLRLLLVVALFYYYCYFFFAAFDFLFPPSSQFLHSLLEWTGSLVPLHHHHRQHRALYYSRKWIEGPEYVECQTFSLSSGFAKGWVEIEGGEDK